MQMCKIVIFFSKQINPIFFSKQNWDCGQSRSTIGFGLWLSSNSCIGTMCVSSFLWLSSLNNSFFWKLCVQRRAYIYIRFPFYPSSVNLIHLLNKGRGRKLNNRRFPYLKTADVWTSSRFAWWFSGLNTKPASSLSPHTYSACNPPYCLESGF